MFTALFQVAKNTFRESLREPIYLLVLLTALVLIGLYPWCTLFVFRAEQRLVVDSSLATMLLFGWGIAVLISSYAVSREIDNGTALLLLSKPVRRPVFIVAKILGILGAVSVFWFLTTLATLISLRVAVDQFWIDTRVFYVYMSGLVLSFAVAGVHNYVTRSSFPMMAVLALCVILPCMAIWAEQLQYQGHPMGLGWRLAPGLVLILFSIWAMASLATALSTRFNLTTNLLLCSVIFLVGLMSDYCLGRFAREPWQDTVPKGTQTLWMCHYTFAPAEVDVKAWSRPEQAEEGDIFRVWTAREKIEELPKLGEDPKASWQDGQGWKHDAASLDESPVYMAEYDPAMQKWTVHRIQGEYADAMAKDPNMKRYDAYAFRRSVNPPRVAKGGSWREPVPSGGSYLASVAYALVPNWQLFWLVDALAVRQTVPLAYIGYAFAYVVAFVAFLMCLAVILFCGREVGTQQGMM